DMLKATQMTPGSPTSKMARTARKPSLAHKPSRPIVLPLARALMWLLSFVILALSVVPPSLRPITAVPHKLEHMAIFVLWGMAFCFCYRINIVYQIMGAALFAGAIEIAQYWIPGRHARISDFVIDAAGACAGILFTRIFVGPLMSRFGRSFLNKH